MNQLKDLFLKKFTILNMKKSFSNKSSREVNLEHILPVNPTEGSRWLKDFSNTDERYISTRKIGNLTVLLNSINSSIKNSDFDNKIVILKV